MLNAVIDLSHHNLVKNIEMVRSEGILGVIHKATQGVSFKDGKYKNRKKWFKNENGFLWGAYHFTSNIGSGKEQADFFLDVVSPEKDDLLVLDYENYQGRIMSVKEAEKFVLRIFDVTGIWCGLYSGNDIKEKLRKVTDTILSKCWLWIAQYASKPKNIPPAWNKWTLWQYTDGIAGPLPHTVTGIGKCDRDIFNGDEEELIKFWKRV